MVYRCAQIEIKFLSLPYLTNRPSTVVYVKHIRAFLFHTFADPTIPNRGGLGKRKVGEFQLFSTKTQKFVRES